MLTVNGDLVQLFAGFVGQAMNSFVPLLAAVIGLFLAFAIADKLGFFVRRVIKK